MILNQRQLGISHKKLADLMTYREVVGQRDSSASKLELGSVDQIIDGLKCEIRDYECLFNSRPIQIEVESLDDLPLAMIRARIASGLTHKELADRLRLTESAVQRYEKQRYRGVSFERLRDVINAIGIPVLVRHNPITHAESRTAAL